jgi:heme/copper-type cytochrome/quinol oxidase subunit 2
MKQGRGFMMDTQLQQLQAQAQVDAEVYRACMLLTVMAKLVMALILGMMVVCSFLVA